MDSGNGLPGSDNGLHGSEMGQVGDLMVGQKRLASQAGFSDDPSETSGTYINHTSCHYPFSNLSQSEIVDFLSSVGVHFSSPIGTKETANWGT